MFLPKDIRCIVCSNIFCCANCRKRHQNLAHVDKINANHLNLDCPICNGVDVFILHNVSLYSEKLLEHIVLAHLPMQCKKCFKMFDKISNFCDENSAQCRIELPVKSKSTESPGSQLETIPELEINNKIMFQNRDPSMANIQQTRLSVDSAFSLRNVSSIMKIDQSADASADHTKNTGKKLVRTTSTPVQGTFQIDSNSKQTPDSSSGGHVMMMSSINQHTPETHSCSENESDGSHNPNNSSSFVMKKPTVPKNPRNKILMAATPLRQVMSKSIQRAIQEHGIKSFNEMREHSSRSQSDSSMPSPRVEALDLRTTPVIRRSESISAPLTSQMTENSQNLKVAHSTSTMEISSGVTTISSTNLSSDLPSAYVSCKAVTSIANDFDSFVTPKNTQNQGGILKKTISFTSSACENTPVAEKSMSSDDSESDIWFTPSTVLTRSQSCSILDHPRKQIDENDDVFIEESIPPAKKKSGLWSLVAKTVMRIKSFGGTSLTNQLVEAKKETSLPKHDDHLENHEPPYTKRRKISQNSHIYSIQSNAMVKTIQISDQTPYVASTIELPRRRKIHGRPAISRMLK